MSANKFKSNEAKQENIAFDVVDGNERRSTKLVKKNNVVPQKAERLSSAITSNSVKELSASPER